MGLRTVVLGFFFFFGKSCLLFRILKLSDLMLDGLLNLTLILAAYIHVLLSPYTKVEESFSIQAIHDILAYGISPKALAKVSKDDRGNIEMGRILSLVCSN